MKKFDMTVIDYNYGLFLTEYYVDGVLTRVETYTEASIERYLELGCYTLSERAKQKLLVK